MHKYSSLALTIVMLQSCSYLPELPDLPEMPDIIPDISLPEIYREDIKQGSILTQKKVSQLAIGMSEKEVKDVIGSPAIIDPFHANQWDYINFSIYHKKENINYRLRLVFDQGVLKEIDKSKLGVLRAETIITEDTINDSKQEEENPWYKFW